MDNRKRKGYWSGPSGPRPLRPLPLSSTRKETNPADTGGANFMMRDGQNIIIVKPTDFATLTYPNRNMFKAKCLCPNTLTHEECILNWSGAKGNNKCDVCEQEVQCFSGLIRYRSQAKGIGFHD